MAGQRGFVAHLQPQLGNAAGVTDDEALIGILTHLGAPGAGLPHDLHVAQVEPRPQRTQHQQRADEIRQPPEQFVLGSQIDDDDEDEHRQQDSSVTHAPAPDAPARLARARCAAYPQQ